MQDSAAYLSEISQGSHSRHKTLLAIFDAGLLLGVFACFVLWQRLDNPASALHERYGVWMPAVLACVYSVPLAMVIARYQEAGSILRANRAVLLLLVAVPLSALWSIDTQATLQSALRLAGTVLTALALYLRFGSRGSIGLLLLFLAASAMLSLITVIVVPSVGVMSHLRHVGDWRGLYWHKNSFGYEMGIAAAVAFFAALRFRGLRRVGAVTTALGTSVLLFKSGSRLAWMATVLTLLVVCGLLWIRRRTGPLPFLFLAIVVAGVFVGLFAFSEVLVGLIGRDLTLTGRAYVWQLAADDVLRRPWLGHGYRAYWQGDLGAAGDVRDYLGWDAFTSGGHNGYLDMWLELGFGGLALYLIVLTRGLRIHLRRVISSPTFSSITLFGVLVFIAILDLAHSQALDPNRLITVMFFLAIFSAGPWGEHGERGSSELDIPASQGVR